MTPLIKNLLSITSFSAATRLFSSSTPPTLLRVGDALRKARTFTAEDVLQYSEVTHDSNPLHFDPEVARMAGFEGSLVHGMLVSALFPRIIASHFPGAVYVSQSLQFKAPVYIGDEVVGEVKATNIRENKNRYIVKFTTRCFKNGEVVVIDGDALAILPALAVDSQSILWIDEAESLEV